MTLIGAVTAPATPQPLRAVCRSGAALTLFAAVWLAGVGNIPFWRALWQAEGGSRPGDFLFLLSVPLAALAWTYVLLLALAWGRATKIVLATVLLASAGAGYFTYAYGVLLDASMVANIAQTHVAEARDLVSWRAIGWLAIFGGLPAALIAGAPMRPDPVLRELRRKFLHVLMALACLASMLMLNYQHYASTLRNHRELRLMLVPHNVVAALHSYVKQRFAPRGAFEAVGLDARRRAAPARKPMITVLVVGETARAANFSLNGYSRPTTPELARRKVLNFPDVSACGTSTAVSLPCMFAGVGRARYDGAVASRREGLLDVLRHAGIKVIWRDNNSGCKGVCERVPHEFLPASHSARWCRDGECLDGILLDGLQDHFDAIAGDTVIVLHMAGSHGPAYFRRYPPSEEVFQPACRTPELNRCSRESIVNAYDNSIRYTDHVLSELIKLLDANASRFDTAMLYVSDHGESLGENGLYLHGIPYALAPREQTHVPMVAWLSASMYARLGLDHACLVSHQRDPLSHDNLFHSVLGLAMVETNVYDPARDLFRSCRA